MDYPQSTRSATTNRRSTPCAPVVDKTKSLFGQGGRRLDASLDAKPGLGDGSGGSRLGRHVALSIAAVVALLLSACGGGGDASESTSETASGSTLPRDVVLTL